MMALIATIDVADLDVEKYGTWVVDGVNSLKRKFIAYGEKQTRKA